MRLEMCPRSSLKPSRRRRLIPPLRQRAAPACRLTRAVAEGGGMRTAANASPAAGCWLLAAEAAPGRPEARFLTQTRATVHAARGRRVHGVRPTLWRGKQCRGAAVRQCRRLAAQPAARGACLAPVSRAPAHKPPRPRAVRDPWRACGQQQARPGHARRLRRRARTVVCPGRMRLASACSLRFCRRSRRLRFRMRASLESTMARAHGKGAKGGGGGERRRAAPRRLL